MSQDIHRLEGLRSGQVGRERQSMLENAGDCLRDLRKPIGVIVCTHGGLANSLVETAQEIYGPLEHIMAVALAPRATHEEQAQQLCHAVSRVDGGNGVLALVDILGGTPSNLALKLSFQRRLEVVAGVNLPMLFKAVEGQSFDLSGLAERVREAGARHIIRATTEGTGTQNR